MIKISFFVLKILRLFYIFFKLFHFQVAKVAKKDVLKKLDDLEASEVNETAENEEGEEGEAGEDGDAEEKENEEIVSEEEVRTETLFWCATFGNFYLFYFLQCSSLKYYVSGTNIRTHDLSVTSLLVINEIVFFRSGKFERITLYFEK